MRTIIVWVIATVVLYVLAIVASSTLAIAAYGFEADMPLRIELALSDLWLMLPYGLILAAVLGVSLLLAAAIARLFGAPYWLLFILAGAVAAAGLPLAGILVYGEAPLLASGDLTGLALQAGAGLVAGIIFAICRPGGLSRI